VLGLAPGRVGTERDGHGPGRNAAPLAEGPNLRLANAELTLSFASRGIRSSVVRLAPTVHGDGDTGFVPVLIGIARTKGVAGYVGTGSSRWPAVHRFDAAPLFRLAVEKAPAGSTLHGVAEEGVATRDIAEAIGRHLKVPVVAVPPEEAAGHFMWLADFVATDSPASSEATRELLGWQPTHPGLIDDLDQGHYFGAAAMPSSSTGS